MSPTSLATIKPNPLRMLYILTPGYSGSTLLSYLLATHPRVSTIGEFSYLHERVSRPAPTDRPGTCSCGKRLHECQTLREIWAAGLSTLPIYLRRGDYIGYRASAYRGLERLAKRVAPRGQLAERVLARARSHLDGANAEAVSQLMKLTGTDWVVDASKGVPRARHLMESDLFDLHFIHLVRDGRGQVNSCLQKGYLDVVSASKRYAQWHADIGVFLASVPPERQHRVSYEELCQQPNEVIPRLWEAVGLPPAPLVPDFRRGSDHMIGNPGVLFGASTRIANPELWRSQMSAEDLAVFEHYAGQSNRDFGYVSSAVSAQ